MTIPGIAFGYLYRKLREVNIKSFLFQLFMSPLRPFVRARREEDFQPRICKYHSTHITAIRDQTRSLSKCPLSGQ